MSRENFVLEYQDPRS